MYLLYITLEFSFLSDSIIHDFTVDVHYNVATNICIRLSTEIKLRVLHSADFEQPNSKSTARMMSSKLVDFCYSFGGKV